MKLRNIMEDFETSTKYKKETYPIFVSPNKKELREIAYQGKIRLIIDERGKKIYAFDPHLIHSKAAEVLGFNYSMMGNTNGQFFVMGNYSNGSNKMYVEPASFKYIGGKPKDWIAKAEQLSKEEWFNKHIGLTNEN